MRSAARIVLLLTGLAVVLAGCSPAATPASGIELRICQGTTDRSPFHIQKANGKSGWMLTKDGEKPRGHVNVVFANNTKATWIIHQQTTRWGWDNIRFELTDEKGTKYTVRNQRVEWNVLEKPNEVHLPPGQVFVRDCFIQGWEWTPKLPEGEHKLKGYAIFDIKHGEDERLTSGEISFHGPDRLLTGPIKSNAAEFSVDTEAWVP